MDLELLRLLIFDEIRVQICNDMWIPREKILTGRLEGTIIYKTMAHDGSEKQ